MNNLLAIVVPLSLGAAVSPTALAVIVLTLSSKVAPRARAWVETLGFVIGLVLLTIAFGFFAQWFAGHRPDPAVMASTDVVFGVILLGLAIHTWLARHNGEGKKRHSKAPGDKAGSALGAYFMIGLAMLFTDVTSLVLYLPALKDIAQAAADKHVTQEQALIVAAIPFFAVIAPVLIPAALASLAPKLTDKVLKPFGEWVDGHSKIIGLAIELIFGVYLVAKGGLKLLGH